MAIVEFYVTIKLTEYYHNYDSKPFFIHEIYYYDPWMLYVLFYLRIMSLIRVSSHMSIMSRGKKDIDPNLYYLNLGIIILYSIDIFIFPWAIPDSIRPHFQWVWIQMNVAMFLMLSG